MVSFPVHQGPGPDPSIATVGELHFLTSLRLPVIARAAWSQGCRVCPVTHQDTAPQHVVPVTKLRLTHATALASVGGMIKVRMASHSWGMLQGQRQSTCDNATWPLGSEGDHLRPQEPLIEDKK